MKRIEVHHESTRAKEVTKWHMVYPDAFERCQCPCLRPSKKECIQQAQLIKAEYLAGRRRIASNDITLREAITEYIDAKKVYPRPPCRAMKKAAINTSSVLWINRFAIST